jgi:hypothetical protein
MGMVCPNVNYLTNKTTPKTIKHMQMVEYQNKNTKAK